jgi:Xaa-Pro dipeptidase
MVVTVEPGIYFSVYALQHFYLPSPIHSKYINVEVVQRYLPVGGVRIEDDILITSKSYENLTTAPKGEAMLDIIRVGKSSSTETQRGTSSPRRRSSDDVEIPLRRAPGISNKIPQLIQRPLARAATMPAELPQQTDIDFEPYTGPSLFSNFPRSMTTEEKVQHWRRSRDPASTPRNSPATVQKPLPVCGELDPNFQHVYMSDASNLASSSRTSSQTEGVSACKNCHLLVQTLHRLRQNLSSSAQTSPKPEAKQPSWTGPLRNGMETARAENPGLVRHMNEAATKVSLTPVPVIQANRQEDKSKSRFSTRYVPYNELLPKHPHDLDNRTSRTVPSHKQPAVGADKNQHKRQPIHPVSSSGHPNPGGLPIPPAIPSNAAAVEDVRQHLEALQIKLQSLENNATLLKQSRPQHSYHGNPHPRPSMPDLSSHNPWQQHTTLPHQPAHSTSVNELLDELMADEERLKRGEPEMLMHRTQRTAARRNKLYLR